MLTPETVAAIANQKSLVLRNLQITQSYYRIHRMMRRLVGKSNASWWTFGMHASKTAGQAIRHETLPPLLKSAMIRSAGFENTFLYLEGLDDLLKEGGEMSADQSNAIATALTRISGLVSEGNLLIFNELALLFTEFCPAFWDDWQPDEAKLMGFIDERLRPGPLEAGGQDHLREALQAFYAARFETDPKRKAEIILKGNLLVGLHEQTRLQPLIAQALAVPFDVLVPPNPNRPGQGLRKRLRGMVSRMATDMMMTYALPNKTLKLGQNVAQPTGLARPFPEYLVTLEDPRLIEIVTWLDRSFDTLSGSAADNWGRLEDRMRFIVRFFRSYQRYKPLFDPPFTPEQAAAIEAGYRPAGPL